MPEELKPITNVRDVPCCPALGDDCPCDVLDFHYRLTHPTSIRSPVNDSQVLVEVIIRGRFERCPGPLALGDLVYSTTLLPGESVRLFTADRRSRFTFDSETNVSYRHEQSSEERFYMASVHNYMSDVTVRDRTSAESQSQENWSTSGSSRGVLGTIFKGPKVTVSGSHSASSTFDFLRELRAHAESSDRRSVVATRAASSVSVGEVSRRTHAEGESEDHFEASSRSFSNPNRCHAITFYFYQINKTQKIKFTIESIQRRVIDPAADTEVTNNPPKLSGAVGVIERAVLATDVERLNVEQVGRTSVAAERAGTIAQGLTTATIGLRTNVALAPTGLATRVLQPLPVAERERALAEVDEQLVAARLLDKPGGVVSRFAQREFSFESCSSLPTPGLLVRGCLDECNICEEALQRDIQLDLDRKFLENELLKRQIELLDQSQEYRCCPAGSEEEEEEEDS